MDKHLRRNRGALHHTSVRRKVSFQHGKSARLAIGIVKRSDDLWIFVLDALYILPDRLSCHGHAVLIQQSKR